MYFVSSNPEKVPFLVYLCNHVFDDEKGTVEFDLYYR